MGDGEAIYAEVAQEGDLGLTRTARIQSVVGTFLAVPY